MDSIFSTPLFDMFRRGEVAHDLRMLAAQGILAPRAHEQLALLVLLAGDSDGAVREAAELTLSRIPRAPLSRFLGRSDVPHDIRAFFAARGIPPEESSAELEDQPLLEEPANPAGTPDGSESEDAEDPDTQGSVPEEVAERLKIATIQRLALLNVTGKVKAAMRGNREERAILIRDPNRLVAIAVMSSPKLTEQEVETFARMGSVSEDVLRVIGTTRAWVKNYGVIRGLCLNPKTPVGLSLGFLKRLMERDIKQISTDRNIPDPVKIAARKTMQAGQTRRV